MQRLFSTFPGRGPGAGLLLLRAIIGAAAVAQGTMLMTGADRPAVAAWGAGLLAIVCGVSLLVGFLTPCAAALVMIGAAVAAGPWWAASLTGPIPDRLLAALIAGVAAAVVPLGPGAFSLDAYLFGRREIVIRAAPGARS